MEPPGLLTPILALTAALIGAALAARLRQPVVLGYLLAGMLIGPFTPGPVGDLVAVRAIADVGIVLLMFAIGVEISLRELVRAGKQTVIGAPIQIAAAMALGIAVALWLQLPLREALFFGAAVAISSTALLTKLLGDLGQTGAEHARIALSWSAVQDLAVVGLVVVLSAAAAPPERLLVDTSVAVVKAGLFVGLVTPIAVVAVPRLLDRVSALRNREVFVLTIAVVALGAAYVSSLLGLSLALGAFVAGLVVGDSDLSHHVVGEVGPLRDIFAGLFFVSVGMLIDPAFVVEEWGLVLLVLALAVLPKALLIAAILWAARARLETAALAAVLLANSGEFSFLLAEIGVGLGVVSPATLNAVLAGGAASMLLTPYLARGAQPVVQRLAARRLPSALADLPEGSPPARHAVICGYGRVGRVVGEALRQRGLSILVIEHDHRLVRALRAHGVNAIAGNAGNPRVLERAKLDSAAILVVAIPDPVVTRQVVHHAREMNPRLDIVARVHSSAEAAYLRRHGVAEAVMGEHELAIELTRHTLHRFGLTNLEILAITRGMRERLTQELAEP